MCALSVTCEAMGGTGIQMYPFDNVGELNLLRRNTA